jgi:hypothetical protein
MNNRYLLALALLIVVVWMVYKSRELYQSGRTDYRYGFVDTNPSRRVSDAFDSPNIDNPYEGLPLP